MISSLSEKNCKVMKKEETISTSGVSLSVFLIRNVIPAESVFWLISSYCIHLFLLLAYESLCLLLMSHSLIIVRQGDMFQVQNISKTLIEVHLKIVIM